MRLISLNLACKIAKFSYFLYCRDNHCLQKNFVFATMLWQYHVYSWLTDGWGMRGLKTHVQIPTITITRKIRKRQKKKPLMKPHVQSCDMVFGYWSLNLSTIPTPESLARKEYIFIHSCGKAIEKSSFPCFWKAT